MGQGSLKQANKSLVQEKGVQEKAIILHLKYHFVIRDQKVQVEESEKFKEHILLTMKTHRKKLKTRETLFIVETLLLSE